MARSEPGRGSTFTVCLPRSERPVSSVSEAPTAELLHGGDETVLLVDDEESIRVFAESVLARRGYRVLLAADGKEAVEIYREHGREIDIVVLDRIMPHLSGAEAFSAIRRITPKVPVIFVSGFWAGTPEQVDPAEREADALLAKPYTDESLARTVRRVLDARKG